VRAAPENLDSPIKLLSGGQSGVDRAVLDVALARGIAYGGWCPKGGWAEDFPKPPGVLAKYPQLAETPLVDPAQRTEWNVRDADALSDRGGCRPWRYRAAASIRLLERPSDVLF
jgi:hypothetical protein